MPKKILILIMVFFLFGCQKAKEEPIIPENINESEYIEPARDVVIFTLLDYKLQERIKKANSNNVFANYQFQMLFKKQYNQNLTDINGNLINLNDYDRLFVEVVSSECSHCKNQLERIPEFLSNLDATFIQYFNVGNKEEILNFYGDMEIPDNIIIIEKDDNYTDYLLNDLKIKKYPSLISYNEHILSFISEGEINESVFDKVYDISFVNPLNENDFIVDGNNLLTINRSREDVKNDLSEENQNKIAKLDNDDYTEELTYSLMGSTLDFDKISNERSDIYVSDIDDYSYYKDKRLILLYTYLRDNSQTDKIEYLNELIDSNTAYEYIVVLIEGLESSSAALRNMNITLHAPAVSVLGYMPDDFFKYGIASFPSAIFVDEGVFTGGYSNIENVEEFNEAIRLFLSEDCVAYKKNN